MADEKLDNQSDVSEEPQQEQPRKGKKKLIIIIAGAILVLMVSGFFAYKMLSGGKRQSGEADHKEEEKTSKNALLALDPFVLNLVEEGKFLKVSLQFELANESYQPMVTNKVPQLRDAIIVLMSSKTAGSVASPEGKFQLKDELLLRANQTIGKDVFKNLYFTEFVMQ